MAEFKSFRQAAKRRVEHYKKNSKKTGYAIEARHGKADKQGKNS
jgi:hypothetical protein